MDIRRVEGLVSITCLIIGILIIATLMTMQGCKTNIPAIDVSFWAGDSSANAIVRAQENRQLKCSSPEFDRYTCITYEDVQKIFDTLLRCKSWANEPVGERLDVNVFTNHNAEVVNHVINIEREYSREHSR